MSKLLLVTALLLGSLTTPATANVLQSLAQYRDIDDKAIPIEQFQNKVTVLVVADKTNADAAAVAGRQIRLKLGGDSRYEYVVVLDLKNLPGFAHGIIVGAIKDQAKTAEEVTLKEFQKANNPPGALPPQAPLFVPDWDEELALKLWQASPLSDFNIFRQDGARTSRSDREKLQRQQQQLKNTVHVFIIDHKGDVQAHYLGAGTASVAVAKIRSLW